MTGDLSVHALFSPYEQQGDNVAFNCALGSQEKRRKKKALRKTDIYSGICLDYFSPFKSTELLMLCYKKINLTVKDYHLTKKMSH